MDELNFTNIIIEVVIGIVAPVLIAYATNRKTKEESKFYSYITLAEEKFVTKSKKKSNFFMIITLLLYLFVGLNGTLYSLPINKNVSDKAQIIGLVIMSILMIGQFVFSFILIFSDIESLDIKIQKKNFYNLDEGINFVLLGISVVGIIIVILCKENIDLVRLVCYAIILIIMGIQAVYNSFIFLYVKIRCLYHVKEIIIKTKTRTYKNIFNYTKTSDIYDFVCEEENVLKRYNVPVSDVESIEKIIDVQSSYLDFMREEELDNSKTPNTKNRFIRKKHENMRLWKKSVK